MKFFLFCFVSSLSPNSSKNIIRANSETLLNFLFLFLFPIKLQRIMRMIMMIRPIFSYILSFVFENNIRSISSIHYIHLEFQFRFFILVLVSTAFFYPFKTTTTTTTKEQPDIRIHSLKVSE